MHSNGWIWPMAGMMLGWLDWPYSCGWPPATAADQELMETTRRGGSPGERYARSELDTEE